MTREKLDHHECVSTDPEKTCLLCMENIGGLWRNHLLEQKCSENPRN